MKIRTTGLEYIRAGDLTPHALNFRTHPTAQREALEGILAEIGVAGALLAYRSPSTGQVTLLDGHLRRDVAPDTAWPVVLLDVDDDEARKILATHDEIAALAERDADKLDALLSQVRMEHPDAAALLAGMRERAGIGSGMAPAVEDAEPQIDRAEELRQHYGVESGQLWALGEHRIICGDSTDAGVVANVLNGTLIDRIFTSPPYDQQRTYNGRMAGDWTALLHGVCAALLPHLDGDAQVFINLGLVHREGRVVRYWDTLIAWLEEHDWPLFGWYVWDKLDGMPGDWNGRLAPSHEWIFHFARSYVRPAKTVATVSAGKQGHSTMRKPDGSLKTFTQDGAPIQPFKIPDSVVRLSARGVAASAIDHPAPFPAGLPATFIQAYGGDVWYEPFSGSGTTILACEQLGRKCRAVEIDPGYVAVAIHRWETATGKQAQLIPEG